MKTILLILVVIGALLLAHNYLQTGKIGFNVSLSDEERELRDLDVRLTDAMSAYRVAGRATAVGGLAPDSKAEGAVADVQRVGRDLARFKESGNTSEVKAEIQALEAKLREARREMGIP